MAIKLYWHRGKGRDDPGKQNFGDFLSPLIVEAVSARRVVYAPPEKADLFAIGSVLKREKKAKRFGLSRKLHIWGTGGSTETDTYASHHYYHAVRGPLTLKKVVGGGGAVFGDPGILSAEIVKPAKKIYEIGVVPHYMDKQSDSFLALVKTLSNAKVVDVFASPKDVLKEISQCHFLVSSSLHGLIVADAYGVPCLHTPFSKGKISEFKFYDYYMSTSRSYGFLDPLTVSSSNGLIEEIERRHVQPDLSQLQEGLFKSFPDL